MEGGVELRGLRGGCLVVFVVVLVGMVCCVVPSVVFGLSGGRVYELVSPVYKGGYGTKRIEAVAPGGESVAFASPGAFEGDPNNEPLSNDYLARRGSSGWSTDPLNTPEAVLPYSGVGDFSSTLESSLSAGVPGPSYTRAFYSGSEFDFLLHSSVLPDAAANFEVAGMGLRKVDGKPINGEIIYKGASPDFSHIVFEEFGKEPLLKAVAAGTEVLGLYDLATQSSGGVSALRFVGLNNSGTEGGVLSPGCDVALGSNEGKGSSFNAVADDGSVVFFTTGVGSEDPPVCAGRLQLFARLGGSRTVEVSRPFEAGKDFGGCVLKGIGGEVPCEGAEARAPAEFQGANEAGTRVFFTTSAPLDPVTDKDAGNDLYMAKIECPGGAGEVCEVSRREVKSLVQVSHGIEPAGVQGVVTVASDGSRVYFVARGVLGTGVNAEGDAPIKGADNLYVYNSISEGPPAFIGDLCSGPKLSGAVEDVDCPPGLSPEGAGTDNDMEQWRYATHEAQTNSCSPGNVSCEPGRYLVFGTYARLVADDTNDAEDVYRYDAVTGLLVRVSAGEGGYDANGNGGVCGGGVCGATIGVNEEEALVYRGHDLSSRAVSEDGSRVVFSTARPLSEDASNGLVNAYEWYGVPGGGVSLISTGSASEPVEGVVISATGRDVFFQTTQGLVSQDTDGLQDVYDARLGGGFPPVPVESRECEGEACQGPLTNPPPLLMSGSVSQAPGGNFSPPPVSLSKPVVKAKKVKPKKRTKKKKKKAKSSTRAVKVKRTVVGRRR